MPSAYRRAAHPRASDRPPLTLADLFAMPAEEAEAVTEHARLRAEAEAEGRSMPSWRKQTTHRVRRSNP